MIHHRWKLTIGLILVALALGGIAIAFAGPLDTGPGKVQRLAAWDLTALSWKPWTILGYAAVSQLYVGPGDVARMAYYDVATSKWKEWDGKITMASLTAGVWKTFYSDGSGVVNELSLGAAGNVLTSNGAALAPSWQPIASGTVTSVGLGLPASVFSISGSPVITAGTLTGSFVTQTANTIFSGPATGVPATPTFRAMTWADLPQAVKDSIALKLAITRFTNDSTKVWDSLALKLKIIRFTTDSAKVWDSLAVKLGITRFTTDSAKVWDSLAIKLAISRFTNDSTKVWDSLASLRTDVDSKIDTNGTFTNISGNSVVADDSIITDSLVTRVAELKQGGYIHGEDTVGGLSAWLAIDIAGMASLGVVNGNQYMTQNGRMIWEDDTLGWRQYGTGFTGKASLYQYGNITAWGVRSITILPTPAPYIHWKIVYPADSSEMRFNRDSLNLDVPFYFRKSTNRIQNLASGIVNLYDTVGVHTLGAFPRWSSYFWATANGFETPGAWQMNRFILGDIGVTPYYLDMSWNGNKVIAVGDTINYQNTKTDIDSLWCKPRAGTLNPDSVLYVDNGQVKKGVVAGGTGTTNADSINHVLVVAPTPSSGDILRYNGTNWVNAAKVDSADALSGFVTGSIAWTANYRKAQYIQGLTVSSIATVSFNVPCVSACSLKTDSMIVRTYKMITLGTYDTTAVTGSCRYMVKK